MKITFVYSKEQKETLDNALTILHETDRIFGLSVPNSINNDAENEDQIKEWEEFRKAINTMQNFVSKHTAKKEG